MILIMKILLQNEYKIINWWYPTYVYQFFKFPYNYKNRVLACFQTRPKPACWENNRASYNGLCQHSLIVIIVILSNCYNGLCQQSLIADKIAVVVKGALTDTKLNQSADKTN